MSSPLPSSQLFQLWFSLAELDSPLAQYVLPHEWPHHKPFLHYS